MRLLYFLLLSPFILLSQTQIGNDIDGILAGDNAGHSVSISANGSIVAVGSPGNDASGTDAGHARVFQNISGTWSQIGNTINGIAAGDKFGTSVSLSSDGSILAIGGPQNDDAGENAGHVRVFENVSGVWTQKGDDINGNITELLSLGLNVSLSNNGLKIAIGSYNSVRILEYISESWTQLGSDINVLNNDITWLHSITFSGDGSTISITEGVFCGAFCFWYYTTRVLRLEAGNWGQIGDILEGNYDRFISLSNDGNVIATTSWGTGTSIYENISSTWTLVNNTIMRNGDIIDISSDGSIVAIGNSVIDEGWVEIFENLNNNWIQIGSTIYGESIGDKFGSSLSLSGDASKIAIGAPQNDGNGLEAGQVSVYDLSTLLSVEKHNQINAKLYPNPTQNEFTVQLRNNQKLKQVNIYSNLGQFIQTSQKNIINTSKLASGLYYIEIVTDQGKATKKLVIK